MSFPLWNRSTVCKVDSGPALSQLSVGIPGRTGSRRGLSGVTGRSGSWVKGVAGAADTGGGSP